MPAASIVDTLSECLTVSKSGKVQPSNYAGDYKLLGAYDQIINAVADGLDIRLETVVDNIDYSTNGVTVQSGSQTFEATKCIMAVPIGVLQNERITFAQGLEPDRLKAIDNIKQTVAFKTILEFDHPVRPQGFDMVNSHDKGPCQFWDESTGVPDYKGQLIVAWDTGDRARELLALPEPERFSATLEGVRRIAGDSGLNYVNASNYDWRQDQFAFGAYATGEKYLDVMYKPTNDTIFWAGAVMSTVAKAYDSGVEAAEATLKSM